MSINTSKMIYHWGASLSEHALAHKPWITAGFVTVGCSMSMVSKTLCNHFACQGSYHTTHTFGLNFTIKTWAESLVLIRMALPEANSTIVYDLMVPSVSSLPLSSHGLQSRFHRREVSSPNMNLFSKCANLKSVCSLNFQCMATHRRTYTCFALHSR